MKRQGPQYQKNGYEQEEQGSKKVKSSGFFAEPEKKKYTDYSRLLELKLDNKSRPLWMCSGEQFPRLFLETFSPIYRLAYEFIISIAEPVSRPAFIHEYQLTPFSLRAAVTVELKTDDIVILLKKFCKTNLPPEIEQFIREQTKRYGKAKSVLRDNRYFLETSDEFLIEELSRHPRLENALIPCNEEDFTAMNRTLGIETEQSKDLEENLKSKPIDLMEQFEKLLNEDDDEELIRRNINSDIKRVEIHPDFIEKIKEICDKEYNNPLQEEYDFKVENANNPTLKIELKPSTRVRHYQERAISRMFVSGRSRSGIIVLPCGAGKTLVGISAINKIKKRTFIFCNGSVSVEQWYTELIKFTDIDPKRVVRFTSKKSDEMFSLSDAGVLISTYKMVGDSKKRSAKAEQMIEKVKSVEWGLLILDEVQCVPANMFRNVMMVAKSHCKLGLTATLIREDNKIEDLNYLIGPKFYEENWLDLVNEGFLAKVQCVEVRRNMSAEFQKVYSDCGDEHKRNLLDAGNPEKFLAIQYLLDLHTKRKDKILIFGDRVKLISKYATLLKCPYVDGSFDDKERLLIFDKFRKSDLPCVFVSQVGDVSIDLPSANVLIQFSFHKGSRRQEAQRLGRILRPKETSNLAYFYTIINSGTREAYHAVKRQKFLIDQGYAFIVIDEYSLPFDKKPSLKSKYKMGNVEEQRLFLEELLIIDKGKVSRIEEDFGNDPDEIDDEDFVYEAKEINPTKAAGASTFYTEYSRNKNNSKR